MTRKFILIIDSLQEQCGVYSYGLRTYNILFNSKKYEFHRCNPSNMWEYELFINQYKPAGVIINYHPLTMPWLSGERNQTYKQYILFHEGSKPGNLHPDFWLNVDSIQEEVPYSFSVPRPLIEKPWTYQQRQEGVSYKMVMYKYPIISTFGFAFGSKNMGSIVKMVNDQFERATIRIHIPRAYYGDRDGEATAGVIPGCKNEMYKPGIDLEFTDIFLSDDDLINYLRHSTLNIFLYEESNGRGLSSVIDYALSADVPLAINSSEMFRHIQKPEINVANKTLQEIIDQGVEPLKEFKELWSNRNFLGKYEFILDSTL